MAKRLIDSADLIAKLPVVEEDKQISLIGAVSDVVTMISECKPVDAVEVVRCAQCKHLRFKDFSGCCQHMVGPLRPDGYCSYGERKEV